MIKMWPFNLFALGVLVGLALSPVRACAEGPAVRLTVGAEVVHAQGYSLVDVRVGDAWGVRAGLLKSPWWAKDVPAVIQAAEPQFALEDVSYVGFDYEQCRPSGWCAGLGAVRLSDLTYANGTRLNFGVYVRYKMTPDWAIEYVHFSHGSAFGIAEGESNRGWNFVGVSRTWQ